MRFEAEKTISPEQQTAIKELESRAVKVRNIGELFTQIAKLTSKMPEEKQRLSDEISNLIGSQLEINNDNYHNLSEIHYSSLFESLNELLDLLRENFIFRLFTRSKKLVEELEGRFSKLEEIKKKLEK
jgi:hypothetical protein